MFVGRGDVRPFADDADVARVADGDGLRLTITVAHVRGLELAKCRVWRMASETPSLWVQG